MGHYASEMPSPTPPLAPEETFQRRTEARRHAKYVWELTQRKEIAGEWIDANAMITCPECCALVPAILHSAHYNWHRVAD